MYSVLVFLGTIIPLFFFKDFDGSPAPMGLAIIFVTFLLIDLKEKAKFNLKYGILCFFSSLLVTFLFIFVLGIMDNIIFESVIMGVTLGGCNVLWKKIYSILKPDNSL